MKRLIFVICLLACLSACKKEHIEPVNGPGVNTLPKKVVTHDSKDDAYRIQLYTYNSQGLVTKVCMYDSLTPQNQDSIIYFYNIRNQLAVKSTYVNDTHITEAYTFNSFGKLDLYAKSDTIYIYHYTAAGEVDYIIRSNAARTFQDSIDIAPPYSVTYKAKGQGTLGSSHDYLSVTIDTYVENYNGVYYYSGITNFIFIDKDIDFQDEVTYSILPIGQAGYLNMYPRNVPYKYATHASYLMELSGECMIYNASYTFDGIDRLIGIDTDYTITSGSDVLPTPIPSLETVTKTIYY